MAPPPTVCLNGDTNNRFINKSTHAIAILFNGHYVRAEAVQSSLLRISTCNGHCGKKKKKDSKFCVFAGGERRWASRVGGDSRGETFSRGLRNRRRGGGNGAFTAELVRKTKPPFVSFAFFFQSVAIFSFFLRLDDFKVPNSLDSLITQL